MKNTKMILVVAIFLVVFAGGGFYAGMKYQQSQRGQFLRQFNNSQDGQNNQTRGRMGFRPVAGEIINKDDKSITVKLQDGGSKIVLFSDSTIVNKQATGSKSDLQTGESVLVTGKENSDGSITAETISLNPMFREISGTPSAR